MRKPSTSTVIACLALFVALGGTATAARLITSKQIKNGQVKRVDLGTDAVSSSKVLDGSLSLDDLQDSAKSTIEDAGTSALEAFRLDGPRGVAADTNQRVATLSNIPPGVYAVFAKTILTAESSSSGLFNQGTTLSAHCTLDVAGDTDEARALLGGPGANSPGEVSMQITRTLSQAGDASVTCDVNDVTWSASNTSIIALRVGSAPRQIVDG